MLEECDADVNETDRTDAHRVSKHWFSDSDWPDNARHTSINTITKVRDFKLALVHYLRW